MRHISPLPVGLALAALSTFAPVVSSQGNPGQPNPRPAPQWILNALHLTQATIQDLQIPATRQPFRFQVSLGGTLHTVQIEPNDVRTPDFQLLVDDGTAIRRVPTPPSVTWVGGVIGLPDSRAAVTVVDGKLDGIVSLDRHDHQLWGIESVASLDLSRPVTEHVVYTTLHSHTPGATCGTDHANWRPIGQPGLDAAMKIAEIAIDCDLEFYQRNGSNTTTTQNRVMQIINGCDVIYQRDVEIQYTVTTVIVRTARTYNNTDMRRLLPEFESRWNAQHRSVRRDLAHLFTGKGGFSGIVGIAYLGVVCNTGSAYGVDKAFASLGTNVGLVSHEGGHNWNGPHCDGNNPCNIMCSGLGGCSRSLSGFGPSSISRITSFKNSRNCLDDAVRQPAIIAINPNHTPVMPRQLVTLTGAGFDGVTTVNVGNQQVAPRSVNTNSITFLPPAPASFGQQPVSVTNPAGTSNSINLRFDQVTPGFFSMSAVGFSGGPLSLAIAGDPNDNWWILSALNSSSTTPFLGYPVLVGSFVLTQGSLDGVGLAERIYQVPANLSLSGVQMHSQVVMFEETAPAVNWISPILPTNFLF